MIRPQRPVPLFAALAALLACHPLPAQQPGLTLVAEGKSDYAIVRPRDASPSQVYAAEELRAFTKQMTGAELVIVTDEATLPAKAILLGWTRHTAAALGTEVDLDALGEDGFSLRTKPPHLAIVGSRVRGTLYGVYELLEKYGGCRWYAKFHSVIPKRTTWTVPPLDDTQTPAFAMREPFWWGMFEGDFAARCKANGNRMQLTEKHGGKIRFGGGLFVHTFYRLMSPGEFFAAHPEYFSQVGKARRTDRAQLCLTLPEVVRILTGRLRARLRSDPGGKLFSVSQNDWGGYCTCKRCRDLDALEGSPSGTLINFVNQVAAAVEGEFPNAWIETLAYQYTRHPPKTLRPRPNVVPRLCSIECDFSLPLDVSPYPQNVKFVDDIRGWSAITDKLYVWDYTTNFGHYIGPHPNFGCLQGNVKFFRDNHVVGLFEQGAYQSPHAEFAELRAWVLAKLLWNPDQDLEALYEDFFNGYYGPAAKLVRTYFDELQALVKSDEHILRIWSPMTSPWYRDEFFERSAKLWEEAERLAEADPACRYNVRISAIPVIYARLRRRPKMQVRREWIDGMLRPVGVDAEYASLARELLNRLREGKITRVAESATRHRAFVSELKGLTEGYKPITIRKGPLSAHIVAEMGGRVCSLTRGGGPNILHAQAGGVDFANGTPAATGQEREPYTVGKTEASTTKLSRSVRGRYRIDRTISVSDDGLTVTTALTSVRTESQRVQPIVRVALDLGNADCVVARAEGWDGLMLTVPENQTFATGTVPVDGLTAREVLIASPATGRGVSLRLPKAPVERVWLSCDSRLKAVRAFIFMPAQMLDGRATAAFSVELRPVESVPDLPKAPVVKAHRPDRVVVEECLPNLGHPGTWGAIVADKEAEDGFAAKLFNTHFEWCMQWRFDPAWFAPGAKYKLRMRIRVEKTDREGIAFWAGVYDTAKAKGYGSIEPKTSEVKDGYQWYDITTWTPEAAQYIWVGPGRFDKEGGKPSAIEAVYVDRFELTRVE